MKNRLLVPIIIYIITFCTSQFAQLSHNSFKDYYEEGIEALNKSNTDDAIRLFKLSVKSLSDAESCFELAKIYEDKNTVESRIKARKYIEQAIIKVPANTEYRLFHARLLEKFSRKMAFDVYEEILETDYRNTEALFNLGRIKELDFYEYNNSIIKDGNEPSLGFDEFAIEDFLEAENYFKRTIKSDSSNIESYIHLSALYEEIGEPGKGIRLLQKVIKIDPLYQDAYLNLGLLYYKTSELDSSYSAYQSALQLMSEEEKNDFKFNSAAFFIPDDFNEIAENKPTTEFKETVENFWNNSDPLFLTDYNERLLEHYSRVAYSNLKFSVPKSGVSGWNSDRGEILIRYGEPVNRVRFRPFISAGARTSLMLKTDVWFYKNKVFGFVDEYWTGNFRFSTPSPGSRHQSQFAGDTDFFVNDLRRNEPENYEPKFEAPVLKVPYDIVQLKNVNDDSDNKAMVYLIYALNSPDKLTPDEKFPFAHKYGLYFIDDSTGIKYHEINRVIQPDETNNLKLTLYEEYQINSILLEAEPDTGKIAIEIIRDFDNGVFTNRFDYRIKGFKKDELDISDIILANKIDKGNSALALQRGSLSILPNPLHTFTSSSNIFIYYEVYNLSLDENLTSSFEQRITVSKIEMRNGIENVTNSILEFLGLNDEDEKLTLTTNYQSFNKNAPIYLQLDMSKYEKGNYMVFVEIEDKNSGIVINTETILKWK